MEFKKIVYPTWAGFRAPPGVYNRHNALMGRSQSALCLSYRTVLGVWVTCELSPAHWHISSPHRNTITALSVPLRNPICPILTLQS